MLLAPFALAGDDPSRRGEVTVKKGDWHGGFRLYGQRVTIHRDGTVTYGEGPEVCTGLERSDGKAQGFGCGYFPRKEQVISVGWGVACRRGHRNGFEAGAANSRVARVVIRYVNRKRRGQARLYTAPAKLNFDGQFWLSIHDGAPHIRRVSAFSERGRLLHREGGLRDIGTGCA